MPGTEAGVRRLRVSGVFLVELLRKPNSFPDREIVSFGIPADAKIIGSEWAGYGIVFLYVASAEFSGDHGPIKDMESGYTLRAA